LRNVPPLRLYFLPEDIESIKIDVEKILSSGMLTMGEYTKKFEEDYASYHGMKYGVAVNSGTSALEIVLRSLRLRGWEVIVPTNTFTATAASIVFAGGKPVFTDVQASSLCIGEEDVKGAITNKTKAVMVVHIGGLICPDIRAIKEICEDKKIALVEDAAHAQGCKAFGRFAGSFGTAGCFSFYPTKVMTTAEGGIITTDDQEVVEKARVLRDQGKESFNSNIIVELGYNWRLNEISAAIGLSQLKRLPEIIEKRNIVARLYDRELSNFERVELIEVPEGFVHNYYKYTILLRKGIDRDGFKKRMREKGVRCGGEVYWPPLHMQPAYRKLLGVKEGDFPVAEDVCARMVELPIYADMPKEDAEYVINTLKEELS